MSAEVFDRFRADLSAAVTRGRRAAAAAGERGSALRDRNRALAEQAKARQATAGRQSATSPDVQRVATGFRAERGLPVEKLLDAAELLAPKEPEKQLDAKANVSPPPTLGSRPVAGPSGQLPRVGDDDEDFSQARILY